MTAVGGDIEKISINNVIYAVTSETDATRALGGFANEVMPNGDGSARMKKTRKPWRIDGIAVACDDPIGNEQANLQDVADGKEWVDIVMYLASGAIFSGQGQIVGEPEFSNQNTAATLNLSGPRKLVRQ